MPLNVFVNVDNNRHTRLLAQAIIRDNLFPSITEILEKYLTINIVSIIKEEMSQCLYFQATIISFSEVDFIQDQIIKLQLIIDEIHKEDIKDIWKICDIRPEKRLFSLHCFHISMIPERWYQDSYLGMDLSQENNLVFAYEKETTDNTDSDNILLLRKEITIPKCAPPILKKAIDKKTKYGMLWEWLVKLLYLLWNLMTMKWKFY
ncbi:hypothetical protein GLOIN_2v1764817 [Rhizophagus irregularis DAOM 181602=DAOM 197198]|nr:hypothetical protein GLOIN_2v1764817 [Rhizophagus irregularis DAOM 181602=DAOM 197198]